VWAPGHGGLDAATACLLVCCYVVAARVQFEFGAGVAVPTQLVFVPMLFLLPPAAVPLLVGASLAASSLPEHLRGHRHHARIALNVVSSLFAIGPVAVLALAGVHQAAFEPRTLIALALALVAQFALDFSGWAVFGHSPRELARPLRAAWEVDVALTPIGLALAIAGQRHALAVLLGLPLVALLAHFARQRTTSIAQARELSDAYATLLGDIVEADDAYTGLHTQDVVELVVSVCDRMGLDLATRHDAELTALLHDVGKVRIPKSIIRKPGPLTAEERAVIERHTIDGQQMLEQVGGLLGTVGRLVRSCHERWDGGGYPDGLAGEDIPLVARIVCACDAFSAMTTDRTYRKAMSPELAVEELRRCAGTQFDPRVVDALVAAAGVRGRTAVELDRAA
jgi:HD-GYP domain-containing protein (c-di-GMP phosphodiesterase class II)